MDTADFLLFTTSNPKGPRMAELLRLFKSIDDAVATEGVRVKHYVLLQETVALPDELADWQSRHRIFLLAPTRLSLSRARNLMIHRARAENQHRHFERLVAGFAHGNEAVLIDTLVDVNVVGALLGDSCDVLHVAATWQVVVAHEQPRLIGKSQQATD